MKIKITFLICIFLLVTLYQGKCQVVINEICAANFNDYLDNFNDYEDWVELYNPTGADVDIGAHFISDDIDEPTKWQIPGGTVVLAYGYLIIFCSDRDNTDGGFFHTDFGISQGKQEASDTEKPTCVKALLMSKTLFFQVKAHGTSFK